VKREDGGFIRLKENIGKGAMQRTASFNHTYFSSIAVKLAICMGRNEKIKNYH